MAEKITIARPYAKAAFELAREHDAYGRWSQILAGAAAVVADERVARLLSSPRVTSAEIVELLAEASGAAGDEQGKNFFNTLAQNRRLGLLPEIAQIYEAMRAEIENVADVNVVSAVQLDEAQRQRLATALKKRLNRDVRLHCEVDPSLIGGAVVRSGDFVIDGSLKARLDRLAAQITH
jgi:F-type H+-transporting ATPase subunit delta